MPRIDLFIAVNQMIRRYVQFKKTKTKINVEN